VHALARAKEFQDVLGELHDRDVMAAQLLEIGRLGGVRAAGVSKAGLGAIQADLAAERTELFEQFGRLVEQTPHEEFSAELLGAVLTPGKA
jgi:CHAD domain-containing protein